MCKRRLRPVQVWPLRALQQTRGVAEVFGWGPFNIICLFSLFHFILCKHLVPASP